MFVRTAIAAAFSVALLCVSAAATPAPSAPGAYSTLHAADAAACARACALDGICMAWSFHSDNRCRLSAVVAASAAPALAQGFALRAPASLRPPVSAEAPAPSAAPAPPSIVESEAAPALSAAGEDAGAALLGGPVEEDLRLTLR